MVSLKANVFELAWSYVDSNAAINNDIRKNAGRTSKALLE